MDAVDAAHQYLARRGAAQNLQVRYVDCGFIVPGLLGAAIRYGGAVGLHANASACLYMCLHRLLIMFLIICLIRRF